LGNNGAASRCINLRAVDRAVEPGAVLCKIGEQVHIGVEGHDHGEVALAHHPRQEARCSVFLSAQHELLAAACVNQHPERDRKVGLGGKIGYFLRLAILIDLEVIFC